jgi:phosphoribosylglycinamide formyltransferase-1
MKKIAIFASGTGTNAENIARYFSDYENIQVEIILSNKKNAKVLEKAKKLNIEADFFTKEELKNDEITKLLLEKDIDLIVLAGFLWLIPKNLIQAFPDRIINIHPALLPKYGGKGMYGDRVHKEVIKNGEKESGITIHYVNERYDEGSIIFQAKCDVYETDNVDDLAQRVHKLEYQYYPAVIKKILTE